MHVISHMKQVMMTTLTIRLALRKKNNAGHFCPAPAANCIQNTLKIMLDSEQKFCYNIIVPRGENESEYRVESFQM